MRAQVLAAVDLGASGAVLRPEPARAERRHERNDDVPEQLVPIEAVLVHAERELAAELPEGRLSQLEACEQCVPPAAGEC